MAHMPSYPEVQRQEREQQKKLFRQKIGIMFFLFSSLIAVHALITTASQMSSTYQE